MTATNGLTLGLHEIVDIMVAGMDLGRGWSGTTAGTTLVVSWQFIGLLHYCYLVVGMLGISHRVGGG